MEKTLKLVTGDSSPTVANINWSNCFLCEQRTDEKLICPLDHAHGGAGCKTLANNLPVLNELGRLPNSIKLSRLDDGDGLESTFIQRHAMYHKSCSLKYNDKNLQRATKRKSTEEIIVILTGSHDARYHGQMIQTLCVSSVTHQERQLINFAMHLLAI